MARAVDDVAPGRKGEPGKPVAPEERSQRDRAYAEIRDRILANELKPGMQMLETEVAEMLQMSRTPVREALIKLEEGGLVEVKPRHGMRIKPVSPDDMREIYDVLTSLEATAAGLCAARALSEEDLSQFDAAVAEMDIALESEDLNAWAQSDQTFHDLLARFSGNQRLQDIVGTLRDQAHRVRMATLLLRPLPTASNEDHRAVVAAIRAGDAETARRIHHEHRRASGEMLVELLERLGLGAF